MSHPVYGLNELREMFLRFFESKGHLRLPSFSLIPQNDASLLLINSGMAPMKPFFTGEQEPPRHRVTTCQKCIRTGDIENIGHTARHGTYFEMLGNFSFGDYFKTEAIHWAWEFLTSPEWVGLDPNRLYPSVFAGNETTPADDEAFRIWHEEIGIPENRIFKFGKEDNFWEHGSGPCGPCSEIYYDRGEKYGDVVRGVEMGDVSMEFCGGTHLDNTAKVGLFRIKSEGSVASGVRRIEAITGKQTLEELRSGQEKLLRAAQLLKTTSNELESRIGGMLSEMKEIRSQLEKFKEQASLGEARSFLTSAKEVKSLKLVTAQRDGMDANALRKLGDFLRDKEPKIVGVLASVNDGKVTLLAVCGKEAVASGIKAGDIIKAIAPICGGKGGGKPDSAMGGGTEVSKVDDALAAVDDLILSKLG